MEFALVHIWVSLWFYGGWNLSKTYFMPSFKFIPLLSLMLKVHLAIISLQMLLGFFELSWISISRQHFQFKGPL